MNGKIVKRVLTDTSGEQYVAYGATITDAVVNPTNRKTVTEELSDFKDKEINKIKQSQGISLVGVAVAYTSATITGNTDNTATVTKGASASYRVAFMPSPFRKGDIIHFTAESTVLRQQKMGWTTVNPASYVEEKGTIVGLALDFYEEHQADGHHEFDIECPFDNGYFVFYFYNANWSDRTWQYWKADYFTPIKSDIEGFKLWKDSNILQKAIDENNITERRYLVPSTGLSNGSTWGNAGAGGITGYIQLPNNTTKIQYEISQISSSVSRGVLCAYDKDKNYLPEQSIIGASGKKIGVWERADGVEYVRFTFAYGTTKANICPSLAEELSKIETKDDAYTREMGVEKALVAACRTGRYSNTYEDFMALVITDSHSDTIVENNSIVIAEGFKQIKSLIHLGDFCASQAGNYHSTYEDMVKCEKPFYFAIGNHDVGNSTTISKCITNAQAYDRYILPLIEQGNISDGEYTDGKCWYYHDFNDSKIRLIVPYEFDDPNDLTADGTAYKLSRGTSVISREQAEWFCNTLASTPSEYGIVIALHYPFSSNTTIEQRKFSQKSDWGKNYSVGRYFNADIWADIVNAYVTGSAVTVDMVMKNAAEYLNGSDGKYWSLSYDFSGKNSGKFMCYLTGHTHRDWIMRHNVYQDQVGVGQICANTNNWEQAPNSDMRRNTTNGVAKDALNAIAFDKENRMLRLVRIGQNVTDTMEHRDFEQIEIVG